MNKNMQNLYRNLLSQIVLLLVFVGGLGFTAQAQTASINAVAPTVCTSDTASYAISVTGGTAPYLVYFHDGTNLKTILTSNTGAVQFDTVITSATTIVLDSVMNNGGATVAVAPGTQATVNAQALPTAIFNPTFYQVCEGTLTNIQLVLTGTGTMDYIVQDGGGGNIANSSASSSTVPIAVTPLLTTSYFVTSITDALGCVGTTGSMATVNVKDSLVASIIAPTNICISDNNIPVTYNITGSGAPYNVYYSVNTGDSVKTGAGASFTDTYNSLSSTTTFTVDSMEYSTGLTCKSKVTTTKTIIVDPLPTADLAESVDTLCASSSKNLSIAVTGSGTVFVRYKSDKGFSNTASGTQATSPIIVSVTPGSGDTKYFVDSVWSVSGVSSCTGTITPDTTRIYSKQNPNILLTPNKTLICEGEQVVFTAQVSGDAAAVAQGSFVLNYTVNGVAQNQQLPSGTSTFSLTFTSNANIQLVSIQDGSSPTCTTTLSQNIAITVKPLAKVVFSSNKTICEGQSTTLNLDFTGVSPFQYTINGISQTATNDTIITVAPTSDSVFTVTQLVDNLGCVATPNAAVTVSVNKKPATVFTVSNSQICKGSNVNLQVTLTGGNPLFSLFFSGEPTTFNPVNVPNGSSSYSRLINNTTTYTLDSIIDNSTPLACTFQIGQSQVVTAIDLPTATISTSDNTVCQGTPVDLNFTVTGSGIITVNYSGTDGNTGSVTGSAGTITTTVTPVGSGNITYSITSIVDGSGQACTNTSSSTVVFAVSPTPTATISGSGNICENNSLPIVLALTGNGTITVNYKDDLGQTYTYTNVAGSYSVPVSVSNVTGPINFTITSVGSSAPGASCTGTFSGTASFTIVKGPTGAITSNNTNIVSGGAARLDFSVTGVGPFDITYSDGNNPPITLPNVPITGTSVTVTPTVTTTYTILNVLDKGTASQCNSGPQGNVTIIVSNTIASISGNSTVCLGDSFAAYVSFSGSGPYTIVVGDQFGNNRTYQDLIDGDFVYIVPVVIGVDTFKIKSVTDQVTSASSTNTSGQAIANVVQQKSVTISGSSTVCEGTSSTLTFDLVGTGSFNVIYTDGTTNYSFNATAAGSPIIRSVPANALANGVNTFTIVSVTNSNPSSVCPIVFSGTGTITVRPTPVVLFSLSENPICKDNVDTLKFNFPSAGPFDVYFTTDSSSTTKLDSAKGVSNGYFRTFVATGNTRFTATQARYSASPSCINNTTSTILLTINNKPTAAISGTATVCQGSSANVRFVLGAGKRPYTVVYNDGISNKTIKVYNTDDTTIVVTPNATTTYTVVSVTDSNTPNCSSGGTGSAVITVNPLPNVTITLDEDSICAGQTARVKFDCSGVPPFTINYTENGVAKVFNATALGENELVVGPSVQTIYKLVSVSDGSSKHCSKNLTGADTLEVLPRPNVSLTTTTPEVCEGTYARVRANVTGNGNITVHIQNVGASYDTSFTVTAGTYFFNVLPQIGINTYTAVTVSDDSPLTCSRTNASSVVIRADEAPSGTISTTTEVCQGGFVDLKFDITGSGLMTVNFANDRGYTDSFTTTGGITNLSVDPAPETGYIKYFITSIQSANGVICTGVSTDTAIALVNPTPAVSIKSPAKTICRGDGTSLIFSVAGNGPFQVNFTDGVTPFVITLTTDSDGDGKLDYTFPVTPSQTTTYRVTRVTDNSNPTCVSTSTVAYTVIVNQKPTASIGGNNVICEGDSTTLSFVLTGRAPLTLVYTGNGNTYTVSGLNPGVLRLDTVVPSVPGATYSVLSITDSNAPACTTAPGQGSASIVVNARPTGTISVVPSPICSGQNSSLNFTVSGGIAPYTIIYSAGGLNDTVVANTNSLSIPVNPTITTTYNLLSITDNSVTKCSRTFSGPSATATLTVNPQGLAKVDVTPLNVCNGDPVMLTFTGGSGANTLTVNYNMNGAPQPSVSLNTDNSGNDGIYDETFSIIPTLPAVPTDSVYFVITSVTVNGTGCANGGGDSAAVFVNPTPTANLISATPNRICEGDTSVLRFAITGAGDVKVVFRHMENGIEVKRDSVQGRSINSPLQFQAVPFVTTTYEIVSVSSNNSGVVCAGTIGAQTQQLVTVNPKPGISVTVSDNPICAGGQTILNLDFTSGTGPFDVEYVVKKKGAAGDTSAVNNIISGYTQNILLTDTTDIYVYKVTDSATPACVSNDSVGVRVNVNPLPSARIYKDSTYCTAQQEGFYVDLVGIGNITFAYRDNAGNFYPSMTRPAGTHFIPLTQAVGTRTYTLVSVVDQSIPNCTATFSGAARVTVLDVPSAIFSGVAGICEGEISTITIQLVGGTTDTITVYYHDKFGGTFSYSDRAGIYDVTHLTLDSNVYTPDSVRYNKIGCPGTVSGVGKIDVRPTPEGNVSVNTQICNGQEFTAKFDLYYDGPFDITYQLGDSTPVNVHNVTSPYEVTFLPKDTTMVRLLQLVYTDIPLCSANNLDSLEVNVNDSLMVIASPKDCNDISTGFTLDLTISGGQSSSYHVNGVPVTSPYTTPFIPNGSYSFTVTDSSGCPSVVIAGNDTCACTTYSGTMANLLPLEACENQVVFATHNGNEVLDANDTLVFVLTDRNDGIIGNVYGVNQTPGFVYNPAMQFEKTYIIIPVASDRTLTPGYNTNDRCLSVGVGTPVVFHQNTKLDVQIQKNDSGYNCVGDMITAKFTFTGNGGLGPYNLVFNVGNGSIARTVNGPVYTETFGPISGSGGIKIEQFQDLSITSGCELIVDADSLYPFVAKPLPAANFTVSDNQVCQGEAVTFTPSVQDATSNYFWIFGDQGISYTMVPTHTYGTPGNFNANLTVTDKFGCISTSTNTLIQVQERPVARFSQSPLAGPYCYTQSITGDIVFTDITSYAPCGDVVFILDGVVTPFSGGCGTQARFRFGKPGDHVVKMVYTSPFGCSDTASTVIHIEGPTADIKQNAVLPCVDEPYNFRLDSLKDTKNIDWTFTGNASVQPFSDVNPVTVTFPRNTPVGGNITAHLVLTSASGCKFDTTFSVAVYTSTAVAGPVPANQFQLCDQSPFNLSEASQPTGGNNQIVGWHWSFGNGSGIPDVFTQNPGSNLVFAKPGTYDVVLEVTGKAGCKDRDTVTYFVQALPDLYFPGDSVCSGQGPTPLIVTNRSGRTTSYIWTPSPFITTAAIKLDPATSRQLAQITSTVDAPYTFTVTGQTDSAGIACQSTASATFWFYNLADPKATLPPNGYSATYAIGYDLFLDTVPNMNLDLSDPVFSYNWIPTDDVSCSTCPEPVISTRESKNYVLVVQDKYGCYSDTVPVSINILFVESLDMPDAFTPNNDGVNDVIYPDGLALKDVVEFKIFNRWGDVVHDASGDKLKVGWDGKVNGKLQQQDVYSYTVTVNTFTGKQVTKKGKFSLMR